MRLLLFFAAAWLFVGLCVSCGKATDGPPSYHVRREEIYRRALEVFGLTALVA